MNELQLLLEARAGDASAKESLIRMHSGLIWKAVHSHGARLRSTILEPDDMFSVGVIALLRCVELFDPTRGLRFSTYAGPAIVHAIAREVATHASPVRVPVSAREKGIQPPPVASMDEITADGITLGSLLPSADDVEAEVISSLTCDGLLSVLQHRERTVVRLTVIEERTAAEVAATVGLSKGAVHRLRTRALKRLRLS